MDTVDPVGGVALQVYIYGLDTCVLRQGQVESREGKGGRDRYIQVRDLSVGGDVQHRRSVWKVNVNINM